MKIIDFITYVLKCNIFRCLASYEASGSKYEIAEHANGKISSLASHEASGSKSSLPHKIYIVFCLASQRCKGAVTSKQP